MTTKIKSIIVDDEANSRKVLATLLIKFCPLIELVGEAEDVDSAYDLITSLKPDLVFLDIQMPTGSGFQLLKKFENLPFEVIFVTSFDRYAITAIKFSVLDYLLKPVEVNDLQEAVKKAGKKILENTTSQEQILTLLNNIDESNLEKKINVHVNGKVMIVKASSICIIDADSRYCHITTNTGEKFAVTKTLKEVEEFLATNPVFVRINKNAIININSIHHYSKGEPCIIELRDGRAFEVSRRKKNEVLSRLNKR